MIGRKTNELQLELQKKPYSQRQKNWMADTVHKNMTEMIQQNAASTAKQAKRKPRISSPTRVHNYHKEAQRTTGRE